MKINFIPQNIKCIVDKSKIGWVEEEKKRKRTVKRVAETDLNN